MALVAPQGDDYFNRVPKENRHKLDWKLDAGNDGVQRHLGEIADAMDQWEGRVSTALGLTPVDVASIKARYRNNLNLQT